MSDHPGFEFWKTTDTPAFPMGEITLDFSDDRGAFASAEADIPTAQPNQNQKTVAERYIGITDSSQLWFALECTTQANGTVTCEGVMRGKHLHWFPDHHETGPGPLQEIRLSAAELKGGGRKEQLGAHGNHCDIFSCTWFQTKGKVGFELHLLHYGASPAELIEERKRWEREAERHPHYLPQIDPIDPSPTPPPKPDPGPNPN